MNTALSSYYGRDVPQRFPPSEALIPCAMSLPYSKHLIEGDFLGRLRPACPSPRARANGKPRSFDSRDHLTAMLGAALGGLSGSAPDRRRTAARPRGPMHLMGTQPPPVVRRSRTPIGNATPGLFFDLLMAMLPCPGSDRPSGVTAECGAADRQHPSQPRPAHVQNGLACTAAEPTAKIHVVYDPRAPASPSTSLLTPAQGERHRGCQADAADRGRRDLHLRSRLLRFRLVRETAGQQLRLCHAPEVQHADARRWSTRAVAG